MLTWIILTTLIAVVGLLGWWTTARRAARQRARVQTAIARLQTTVLPAEAPTSIVSIVERAVQRFDAVAERADTLVAALTEAPVGVLLVDNAGTVVFANTGAKQVLKGRYGDAVAEVEVRATIEETAATGRPATREVELYTPTRRVIGLHVFPLAHEDTPAGVAVFLEDLTARHRVDAIRKDFVANASHELKTPLGALSVLAETLADADDPEVRRRLTERIAAETRRMSHLIDDILDLSLVESNGGDRSAVVLASVFAEAMKHVEVISEEYGVRIVADPPGLETLVAGDHRRLVSALSNLLENAVKYTATAGNDDPAPVELRAARQGSMVVIEVEDHGIGIAEAHVPRIFERFYRVDAARSRRTGGTGLGLAIARHVVLNHGGTIEVESTPGVGSTFRVMLPPWSA